MGKRLVIALIYVVLSINAFAQTSNATLGGTVSDPTGALIPGVSVTATNAATGIVTTVLTNEAGAYQFASLQTGSYKVSAELAGFQTQIYNNVTLGISQQVRLNFALQVSSVAQAVEVTLRRTTVEKRRLFDPYTGRDLGEAMPIGLSLALGLLELHDNLLGGTTGRTVNGVGQAMSGSSDLVRRLTGHFPSPIRAPISSKKCVSSLRRWMPRSGAAPARCRW